MKSVVLALTSCPPAALGPYGNEWTATPNLDRLAAEGVVFDRHISDCPDPAAACEGWLDARAQGGSIPAWLVLHTRPENDPPAAFRDGWAEVIEARPDAAGPSPADALMRVLPPLLDRLAAEPAGVVWVVSDRFEPPWDVPRDVFEVYMEDLAEDDTEPMAEDAEAPIDAESVPADALVDWDAPDAPNDEGIYEEEEDDDEAESPPPIELPDPWTAPETGWFDRDDLLSWELLHRSFAAAVTAWDADVGRIVGLLRERGLDQSATFALTAGRGYPLGEHGLIGPHRPWLHEELVHLPLIVRRPGAAGAGVRVAAMTQPRDLGAILGDSFGAESRRPEAITALKLADAEEWAIRTPEWALLLPVAADPDDDARPARLYRKPEDHWEVNDVRVPNLERADALEARLRSLLGERPA